MKYGQDTVARVRDMMAPGNPVPGDISADSQQDEYRQDQYRQEIYDRVWTLARSETAAPPQPAGTAVPTPRRSRRGRGRTVITPVAAALAVAGVITGVALAGRSLVPAHRPATGTAASTVTAMPRFYVTLSMTGSIGRMMAQVHASQTGQVLSQTQVGFIGDGVGITADRSDRAFVIDARATDKAKHDQNVLYLLRVSASGHSTTLTRLPLVLLPPGSPDVVDGIAVSPDGARLAVALQVNRNARALNPRGEIIVYSLHGGATQTWAAPADKAVLWDPAWTGGSRYLTFVWQDHLTGTIWFSTGRSQVRRLDTAAPGRNLLASQVLVTGGGQTGFIQSASAGPAGSPIIAAVYQVPATSSGTARMRLIALSPGTGSITRVFARHTVHYSGQIQEGAAVASCQVLGADPTGQHTLAYCPDFGRIGNATLTLLPHSPRAADAAW